MQYPKDHDTIRFLNCQSGELVTLLNELSVGIKIDGPVFLDLVFTEATLPGDLVVTELALDISFGSEKVPHELLLLRRRFFFASGVELLIEEVDNSHVVVDPQIVEKRLPDLKMERGILNIFFTEQNEVRRPIPIEGIKVLLANFSARSWTARTFRVGRDINEKVARQFQGSPG